MWKDQFINRHTWPNIANCTCPAGFNFATSAAWVPGTWQKHYFGGAQKAAKFSLCTENSFPKQVFRKWWPDYLFTSGAGKRTYQRREKAAFVSLTDWEDCKGNFFFKRPLWRRSEAVGVALGAAAAAEEGRRCSDLHTRAPSTATSRGHPPEDKQTPTGNEPQSDCESWT